MRKSKKKLADHIRKYHFELKHLMVLFVTLVVFQMITTLVHKISIRNFLIETREWYQNDFVDRLANLSATSLELLLETADPTGHSVEEKKRIIQAFNIVLTQQRLQQHVGAFFLLLEHDGVVHAIDSGQMLYDYLIDPSGKVAISDSDYAPVVSRYQKISKKLIATEKTHISMDKQSEFHIFVPFVPKGEYLGALYMQSRPEFGLVTHEIVSSYNQTNIIFTFLILLGFLGMFFVSTQTVSERDETQEMLYIEREQQLKKDIHHQKETLFTKRIYHTHHKAEKIMGFIKEDLRMLTTSNIDAIKFRVSKYANFISRVIYDMKWFDPPLHTIRSPLFQTDLNAVIEFIVEYIFNRISSTSDQFRFQLELAETLPPIQVNEFVIWEVLEPLIQNSIDHTGEEIEACVHIQTTYQVATKVITVVVSDNGPGIERSLLASSENGVPLIFQDSVTTKTENRNTGYGCYIAYEIATQRCGWHIEAFNPPTGGARFTITIPL